MGGFDELWGRHPIVSVQRGLGWITAAPLWWDDEACVFVVERDEGGLYVLGVGTPAGVSKFTNLANFAAAGLNPAEITRFSVPRGTASALVPEPTGAWEWMHVDRAAFEAGEPPTASIGQPGTSARKFSDERPPGQIVELFDTTEIAEALQRCHPTGELSPDTPGSRWFGWRDQNDVIRSLAGAHLPPPGSDTPWMLGSIGTDPAWRSLGLSRAVVTATTEAGLRSAPIVCLSLYSTSDTARRVYERVGFQCTQRFESYRVAEA